MDNSQETNTSIPPAGEESALPILGDSKEARDVMTCYWHERCLTAEDKNEFYYQDYQSLKSSGFKSVAELIAAYKSVLEYNGSTEPAGEESAIRDFRTTEPAESKEVVKDYLTTEFDNQEVVAYLAENIGGGFDAYPDLQSLIDDCRQGFPVCRCAPKAAMSDEIKNIRSVKVQGDFAVLVEFMSCRSASEFARAIRGEKS